MAICLQVLCSNWMQESKRMSKNIWNISYNRWHMEKKIYVHKENKEDRMYVAYSTFHLHVNVSTDGKASKFFQLDKITHQPASQLETGHGRTLLLFFTPRISDANWSCFTSQFIYNWSETGSCVLRSVTRGITGVLNLYSSCSMPWIRCFKKGRTVLSCCFTYILTEVLIFKDRISCNIQPNQFVILPKVK